MTKEVFLSLKGLQMESGQEAQEMETITPAEYYRKKDSHYVIYEEMTEGFSEKTRNMIKFRDSYLEVSKKGLFNVHMIFEKNKKNMTSYMTPYGNIMIGIDTESVLLKESEEQIKLLVEYSLEANYQHLADCKIELELQSRENGIQFM